MKGLGFMGLGFRIPVGQRPETLARGLAAALGAEKISYMGLALHRHKNNVQLMNSKLPKKRPKSLKSLDLCQRIPKP